MLDKVLLMITTLILKYNESNWIYIMIPGLIVSVISSILTYSFVLDSPQFQHDIGQFSKSKEIFHKIAEINRKSMPQNYMFEKEPVF